MSIITILEALLIGPLKLIFEIIFVIANRLLGNNPGLAIVALSLIMNVMVLPLYRRADSMQEEARDIEAKLHDGVAHIKKTFSGDEQMMILQTYYRQNNYKPTDALNGSASLLLEVPFFMAAYQFLSRLALLENVSFGPIADLSTPDGLLVIGGVAINVLPILMTLINVISSAIYLKGFPLKTKIQLYGMAAFFLVFLYSSPSGLVFYWTLNNLFSLVKTVFYKMKNARKVGGIALFVLGIAAVIFGVFVYRSVSIKRNLLVVGVGVLFMCPLVWQLLKNKLPRSGPKADPQPNKKQFTLGSVFLTILTGMLIPSTYIAASPQEYVDPSYYHDPLLYILITTCLAAGTFLIWMRVFYWLANAKGKVAFDKIVWILCGVMLVNYMFFGRDLGVIYSNLQYSDGVQFSYQEELLNIAVLALVILVLFVFEHKWQRAAVMVLLTASLAIGGMSVLNMAAIRQETENLESLNLAAAENTPRFSLSKTGKNVVVIMLDRAMGEMVPYIFNEKPELQDQFAGFTHYNNTISFGSYTIFGAPVLYGGYEYTPVEMNKRSDEAMVDKHNEALKVMPVLFSQNNYQATLINPVYANYELVPDLSAFDDCSEFDTYITNGLFVDDVQKQAIIDANYRNFFCFSIMKSMPVSLQKTIYCDGTYNKAPSDADIYSAQIAHSTSVAEGFLPAFLDEYSVLCNMATMTEVTYETINTFLFLSNATTHEPMLLQAPEYVPAEQVDNTSYDAAHAGRFTVGRNNLNVHTASQMAHYHINMAAMLRLGEWFDYLRENDVYDNTRIIIVSDHGRGLGMHDDLIVDTGLGYESDVSYFDALLMVKDFNSQEFTTSSEFMTNADVPTLATAGLIQDPVNPFTGKTIDSSEKYAHDQLITTSHEWGTASYKGTTFLPSGWASVTDNLWDPGNWKFSDEQTVLTEHILP